jgi:hypothetical protein
MAWLRALAGLISTAAAAYSAPSTCPAANAAYDGYNVTSVDIRDPIGLIAPFASPARYLRPGLRLAANKPFVAADLDRDSTWIGATLTAGLSAGKQKVRFSFAKGEIRDCTPPHPGAGAPKGSLRVVFTLFSTALPVPQPSLEQADDESNRPGVTGATRAEDRSLTASPVASYDLSRGLSGGLAVSERIAGWNTKGDFAESARSRIGDGSLSRTIGPRGRLWEQAVWAIGLESAQEPVGAMRLGEGKIDARFTASTPEFSPSHILIRYGAQISGGHQQAGVSVPTGLPPNSRYGDLKLYAGVTGRPGDTAFSASGGFQLGSMLTASEPVFRKYLIDLGLNHTFRIDTPEPLGDRQPFTHVGLTGGFHRSVTLEARFTAGLIQNAGSTPLAERFFGGDEIRPFVPDSSGQQAGWLLPGDAYIRSIPDNRLGSLGAALGGSRFYSANATLSYTVWGKPILPGQLIVGGDGKPTGFPEILNGAFDTAAKAIASTIQLKDPAYLSRMADVSAEATRLNAQLTALSAQLKEIPQALAAQPAFRRTLSAVRNDVFSTGFAVGLIVQKPDPQVIATLATSSIPALSTLLRRLEASLTAEAQGTLAEQIETMRQSIVSITARIDQADNVPTQKYIDEAWKKLSPGHRALDAFIARLNMVSVSPVAMLDAARVWPVGQGVHYGVGPGVRVSVVNVNFTLGYSVNPARTAGEKAGALFFKLDVTSLF